MKKLSILIIILSLAFSSLAEAQTLNNHYQSDKEKSHFKKSLSDLKNSHFNVNEKSVSLYLEDSSYYMIWQSSAWKDYWKYVYTYNSYGKIAVENDFSWDGNLMIYRNYERFTFTYNSQNQLILHTFLNYEESTNTWDDRSRTYSFYNNNLKITDSSVFKNPGTSVWENQWKSSFTYDLNGNIASQTNYSWNQTNNVWENSYKIVYTNNSSGKPIELLTYNGGVSSWDTSAKTTIVYNTNGLIADETTYNWYQGSHTWDTSVKLVYSYNLSLQLINISKWQWNYNTNSLQEVRRDGFTYDANNNNTAITTTTWDGTAWVDSEKHLNYWSLHQVNSVEEQNNCKINIFPNPASNMVYFDNYSNKPLNIRLFDVNGKIVADKIVTGNTLDISDIESGIYFIRVENSIAKIIKK